MSEVMLVKPIDKIMPGCEKDLRPQVGDIDTVIEVFKWRGDDFYALERFGPDKGFRTDYFATLPDQSAQEMDELEREAILM